MKMNIGKILATVGGAAINMVIPGAGSAVVGMINGFLPDDKKLPENATGTQAMSAISTLAPAQQAQVLTKECDVEIEEIRADARKFEAMAQVDATGHTARPEVVLMMAKVLSFGIIILLTPMAIAIVQKDFETVKVLGGIWTALAAILYWPASIILRYFGARTVEKQQKYQAATGAPPPPVPLGMGLVSQIAGLFGKK